MREILSMRGALSTSLSIGIKFQRKHERKLLRKQKFLKMLSLEKFSISSVSLSFSSNERLQWFQRSFALKLFLITVNVFENEIKLKSRIADCSSNILEFSLCLIDETLCWAFKIFKWIVNISLARALGRFLWLESLIFWIQTKSTAAPVVEQIKSFCWEFCKTFCGVLARRASTLHPAKVDYRIKFCFAKYRMKKGFSFRMISLWCFLCFRSELIYDKNFKWKPEKKRGGKKC